MSEDMLSVEIWRGAAEGAFRHYEVPARQSQTVLDVITWVQREIDPGLSYRFACRVGMCGSCAMMVNGRPRWTCRSHVDRVAEAGRLKIAPLRNLPVIKDLACDMSGFFEKWDRAKGRFHATTTREDKVAAIDPAAPARAAANAGIECINCGICHAACDVVAWNADYLGPAALNRAWTLMMDARDGAGRERLRAVAGDAGCHACHSHQSCTTFCPNALSPTAAIAGLKRMTVKAALKGEL